MRYVYLQNINIYTPHKYSVMKTLRSTCCVLWDVGWRCDLVKEDKLQLKDIFSQMGVEWNMKKGVSKVIFLRSANDVCYWALTGWRWWINDLGRMCVILYVTAHFCWGLAAWWNSSSVSWIELCFGQAVKEDGAVKCESKLSLLYSVILRTVKHRPALLSSKQWKCLTTIHL